MVGVDAKVSLTSYTYNALQTNYPILIESWK